MSFFNRSRNNGKQNEPELVAEMPVPATMPAAKMVHHQIPADFNVDVLQDPPPAYFVIKDKVQQELLREHNPANGTRAIEMGKQIIEPLFNIALTETGVVLSRVDKQKFLDAIMADILGFGPIQPCWTKTRSPKSWSMGRSRSMWSRRASYA